MKKYIVIFIVAAIGTLPCSAKDYHVYILAGQSNMTGYGMTADLEENEKKPVEGVMIFNGAHEKDQKVGRGGNGRLLHLVAATGPNASDLNCFSAKR